MEGKEGKIDDGPTSIPGKDVEPFSCLFGILVKWVEVQPNKDLWTFLDHNGKEGESLSYLLAAQKVGILANELMNPSSGRTNLTRGDCVLLVYPPCLDFIVAFMACLQAGLIPVPVCPPGPSKLNKDVVAFSRVAANCGAKVALTCSSYTYLRILTDKKGSNSKTIRIPELQWIKTNSILENMRSSQRLGVDQLRAEKKPVTQDQPAFLQYTSGSTNYPKGIIVSHGNIYHNLALIVDQLNARSDTIVCSWLPQYHDMGLIGSYLGVLFCGGKGYYMSPLNFIRHPAIWILAINRYRATHLQSPSFGYTICAKRWRSASKMMTSRRGSLPVTGLDLSCVRHMTNGAEPIDYRHIDAFYETFCPLGLKRGVIFPSYGLAEHTLYVCGNGRLRVHTKRENLLVHKRVIVVKEEMEEEVKEGVNGGSFIEEKTECNDKILANTNEEKEEESAVLIWTGCGKPSKKFGVDVQIVNPSTLQRLGTDRVGEVWVTSGSKALGYCGSTPSQSENTFCAYFHDVMKIKQEIRENNNLNTEPVVSNGTSSTAVEPNDVYVASEGYLRTGDEGFIHGGELFICSRIKDIMFFGGKNYYPQDFERTVESELYKSLRPGCSSAFSIRNSASSTGCPEKLVLVCEAREHLRMPESEEQLRKLAEDISSVIRRQYGIPVSIIVFLPVRGNVKTTSGKLARQLSKKAFIDGELDILYQWEPQNVESVETEGRYTIGLKEEMGSSGAFGDEISTMSHDEVQAALINAVSRIVGSGTNVYPTTPLYELGMDSLAMGQFNEYLLQYGCDISIENLFNENVTIEYITNLITSNTSFNSCTPPLETTIIEQEIQKAGKCQSCVLSNCPCCFCLVKPCI